MPGPCTGRTRRCRGWPAPRSSGRTWRCRPSGGRRCAASWGVLGGRGVVGRMVVADRFQFHPHRHLMADRVRKGGDAEVGAVEAGGGREAGDGVQAVQRARHTIEAERNGQRSAHAVQGQRAVQYAVVRVGAFHRMADEMCLAVLRAIQQGVPADRLVPAGVAHVHAGQVDVEFRARMVQVVRVEAQPATCDVQPPERSRIAVVVDAEDDLAVHGVVAVLVRVADRGASDDAGTQRSRRGSMPWRQPGALARVSPFWHDAARGRGYAMFASLVLGAVLSAAMPLAAGGAGQAGAAAASAAPGTGLLPTPQFRHYDTGDGLPSSAINAVEQDGRGFMWFGGSGGLVRYDGVEFKAYAHTPGDADTLSSNDITQLVCATDGRLWIAT